MAANDYTERTKLLEMVDEANRAKAVWMTEYLRILQHNSYQMKANVTLDNAARAVSQKLDMDVSEESVLEGVAMLNTAIKAAHALSIEAVQPTPTPTDPRKTFIWMIEMDMGMDADVTRTGKFYDPKVEALWQMFSAGAKFGHTKALVS